jgi:predicted RNA-binding protein YlqC (UPF0109 family)
MDAARLEQIVKCPICLFTLSRPVLLGCSHSMCEDCALQVMSFYTSVSEIVCSVCKRATPIEQMMAGATPMQDDLIAAALERNAIETDRAKPKIAELKQCWLSFIQIYGFDGSNEPSGLNRWRHAVAKFEEDARRSESKSDNQESRPQLRLNYVLQEIVDNLASNDAMPAPDSLLDNDNEQSPTRSYESRETVNFLFKKKLSAEIQICAGTRTNILTIKLMGSLTYDVAKLDLISPDATVVPQNLELIYGYEYDEKTGVLASLLEWVAQRASKKGHRLVAECECTTKDGDTLELYWFPTDLLQNCSFVSQELSKNCLVYGFLKDEKKLFQDTAATITAEDSSSGRNGKTAESEPVRMEGGKRPRTESEVGEAGKQEEKARNEIMCKNCKSPMMGPSKSEGGFFDHRGNFCCVGGKNGYRRYKCRGCGLMLCDDCAEKYPGQLRFNQDSGCDSILLTGNILPAQPRPTASLKVTNIPPTTSRLDLYHIFKVFSPLKQQDVYLPMGAHCTSVSWNSLSPMVHAYINYQSADGPRNAMAAQPPLRVDGILLKLKLNISTSKSPSLSGGSGGMVDGGGRSISGGSKGSSLPVALTHTQNQDHNRAVHQPMHMLPHMQVIQINQTDMGRVIGTGGAHIERIKRDTSTTIFWSDNSEATRDITVRGASEESVAKAVAQIQELAPSIRNPSHASHSGGARFSSHSAKVPDLRTGRNAANPESSQHEASVVYYEIEELYSSGLIARGELNERCLNTLKTLPPNDALSILKKFTANDLSKVQNKSAYLTSIIQRTKDNCGFSYQQGGGTGSSVQHESGSTVSVFLQIEEIYGSSLVERGTIDERCVGRLKGMPIMQATQAIECFKKADFRSVRNVSAYFNNIISKQSRGELRGVDQQQQQQHSCKRTILAKSSEIGRVIGKRGQFIKDVAAKTFTSIQISDATMMNAPDLPPSKSETLQSIEILGSEVGVRDALAKIEEQIRISQLLHGCAQSIDRSGVTEALKLKAESHAGRNLPCRQEDMMTKVKKIKQRDMGKLVPSMRKIEQDTSTVIKVPPKTNFFADIEEEIVICGIAAAVEKAIRQIDELLSCEYSRSVEVQQGAIGHLIGPQGMNVKRIQDQTSARIVFDDAIHGMSTKRTLTIYGPSDESVDGALRKIHQLMVPDETVQNVMVKSSKIGHLMGAKGRTIHRIQKTTCTTIDVARTSENGEQQVTVIGTAAGVAKAVGEIWDATFAVGGMGKSTECVVQISKRDRGQVIGESCANINRIMRKTSTQIHWYDRGLDDGDEQDIDIIDMTVRGASKKSVAEAVAWIRSLSHAGKAHDTTEAELSADSISASNGEDNHAEKDEKDELSISTDQQETHLSPRLYEEPQHPSNQAQARTGFRWGRKEQRYIAACRQCGNDRPVACETLNCGNHCQGPCKLHDGMKLLNRNAGGRGGDGGGGGDRGGKGSAWGGGGGGSAWGGKGGEWGGKSGGWGGKGVNKISVVAWDMALLLDIIGTQCFKQIEQDTSTQIDYTLDRSVGFDAECHLSVRSTVSNSVSEAEASVIEATKQIQELMRHVTSDVRSGRQELFGQASVPVTKIPEDLEEGEMFEEEVQQVIKVQSYALRAVVGGGYFNILRLQSQTSTRIRIAQTERTEEDARRYFCFGDQLITITGKPGAVGGAIEEIKRMQRLYKTQLCRSYGKNCCRSGIFCSFAHGQDELRMKVATTKCDGGTGSDPIPPHRPMHAAAPHTETNGQQLYKTQLCRNYGNNCCRYGKNCSFAHGQDELIREGPETHLVLTMSERAQITRKRERPGQAFTDLVQSFVLQKTDLESSSKRAKLGENTETSQLGSGSASSGNADDAIRDHTDTTN